MKRTPVLYGRCTVLTRRPWVLPCLSFVPSLLGFVCSLTDEREDIAAEIVLYRLNGGAEFACLAAPSVVLSRWAEVLQRPPEGIPCIGNCQWERKMFRHHLGVLHGLREFYPRVYEEHLRPYACFQHQGKGGEAVFSPAVRNRYLSAVFLRLLSYERYGLFHSLFHDPAVCFHNLGPCALFLWLMSLPFGDCPPDLYRTPVSPFPQHLLC